MDVHVPLVWSSCPWIQGLTVQFSSDAQSCLTLFDSMDCSTPGLPVHHQLPEPTQTHVIESVMPSNHLILCRPLLFLPSIFPSIRVFPMSQFFTSDGQSIRVSASPSVLLMYIQDWFPLGWTVWISLLSKGLSRVFSNSTVRRHQFFGTQFSSVAQLCPTLCDLMDCRTPGFPVHQQLLELAQT